MPTSISHVTVPMLPLIVRTCIDDPRDLSLTQGRDFARVAVLKFHDLAGLNAKPDMVSSCPFS